MISPTTSNAIEYSLFSITYTITPTDLINPHEILSVTVTASDGVDYMQYLTTKILSGVSFSVSGTLSDVFNRRMDYLDVNADAFSTTRFTGIPSDFNTLYTYIGAVVNSVDLTVTAITSQGVETSIIVVSNNFEVSNTKLREFVAKGAY